jgi:hypothetical protein
MDWTFSKSRVKQGGAAGMLVLIATAGLLIAADAANPALEGVKTVYLLPMASGLDQFLAVRLTTGSILQVVTDPQKADGILTDHIGASFEQQLDGLYGAKASAKDDKDNLQQDFARPVTQPLSRGKGAMFLVDRKTRSVLWSTYALPKNTAPNDMNRLADRIAGRLEKDRKGK